MSRNVEESGPGDAISSQGSASGNLPLSQGTYNHLINMLNATSESSEVHLSSEPTLQPHPQPLPLGQPEAAIYMGPADLSVEQVNIGPVNLDSILSSTSFSSLFGVDAYAPPTQPGPAPVWTSTATGATQIYAQLIPTTADIASSSTSPGLPNASRLHELQSGAGLGPGPTHLPSNTDYPGALNFQVKVVPSGKETVSKCTWTYWAEQKKLYVDRAIPCPFEFSLTPGGYVNYNDMYVRALPIYMKPDQRKDPVQRCPNHQQIDSINTGANYEHFIHCDNPHALYDVDHVTGRRSVMLKLEPPQLGSSGLVVNLLFTCLTSCPGGPNRRPTQVVFTLEKPGGQVVGRQAIEVRVCACPGRDRKVDEKKWAAKVTVKKDGGEQQQSGARKTKRAVDEMTELITIKKTRVKAPPSESNVFTLQVHGRANFELLRKIRDSLELSSRLPETMIEAVTRASRSNDQSFVLHPTSSDAHISEPHLLTIPAPIQIQPQQPCELGQQDKKPIVIYRVMPKQAVAGADTSAVQKPATTNVTTPLATPTNVTTPLATTTNVTTPLATPTAPVKMSGTGAGAGDVCEDISDTGCVTPPLAPAGEGGDLLVNVSVESWLHSLSLAAYTVKFSANKFNNMQDMVDHLTLGKLYSMAIGYNTVSRIWRCFETYTTDFTIRSSYPHSHLHKPDPDAKPTSLTSQPTTTISGGDSRLGLALDEMYQITRYTFKRSFGIRTEHAYAQRLEDDKSHEIGDVEDDLTDKKEDVEDDLTDDKEDVEDDAQDVDHAVIKREIL